MIDWAIFVGVFTGLAIFIYGIENFSSELQTIAKERFSNLLRKATKNPIAGTVLGTVITALLQSSTATTVITVSLVSAGLISFTNSLGIILGANIGTTVTAQLVALKLTAVAPFFIIIGFILSFLKGNVRIIGKGLFYFGLLFFGLTLISQSIAPIKADPAVISFFAGFSNIFLAFLAGLVFTAIVQSSSVTTGIVVILSGSGLIGLAQGIPLLLGANIGTTVTTLIASAKLSLHARKAAIAHALFNIIGSLLMLPFVYPFASLIATLGGSIPQQIANAHTIFNIAAALLFLFFLKPWQNLVHKLVRGEEEEIMLSTKVLLNGLPAKKEEAFNLIERELHHSLTTTNKLFSTAAEYMRAPTSEKRIRVEKLEALSDLLDKKIEAALLELSTKKLTKKEAEKVVLLVRISNEIEQLSDVAEDLTQLPSKKYPTGIAPIYDELHTAFVRLQKDFLHADPGRVIDTKKVKQASNKSYAKHVEQLKSDKTYAGTIFVESLALVDSAIDKIKDITHMAATYTKL